MCLIYNQLASIGAYLVVQITLSWTSLSKMLVATTCYITTGALAAADHDPHYNLLRLTDIRRPAHIIREGLYHLTNLDGKETFYAWSVTSMPDEKRYSTNQQCAMFACTSERSERK